MKKIKILKLIIMLIVIFNALLTLFVIDKGDNMRDNNIDDIKDNNVYKEEEKKENNVYENINCYKEENLNRYIEYKLNNEDLTYEKVIKDVNINLDKNFYEDIENALNEQTNLVLVNKHYKLNDDYVPNNLVQVD